jgi:hypothetical protein
MHKVVYNACYGGYGISEKGAEWLLANGASPEAVYIHRYDHGNYIVCDLERHDPLLVSMVETLGAAANGDHAKLVIRVLSQPLYRVNEYDGSESVEEPHQLCWDDASKVDA